jgi:YYY domain-containing protein
MVLVDENIMLIQFFDIFKWYFALQLFSIIGFILGYRLFEELEYKGFSVSKPFGLFVFSIATWFICNKKFALLPYSSITLYVILAGFAGFSYYVFLKNKEDITRFVTEKRKYITSIEISFLVFFLIFVLLRTYTPNIEGTEKPLEFVVINSILLSDTLPPIDAWLSGYTINYYYLGQFIFSNLIKLTFIDPSIGFNLINPAILSMIIIGCFGFMYQLTRSIAWSTLAAFMAGLMGNLEPAVQIINNGWNPDTYRWWEAGHIIPNSFPEFPYWSFLHSDVHAHFLVHPFTLLFLFFMLSFIYSNNYLITLDDFRNKKKLALNTLYCLLLGSFMILNSWNYPSTIALTLAGLYLQQNNNSPESNTIKNIFNILPAGLFYIFFSYSLYLAFYAYFSSPVKGLGIVDTASRTTTGQFLMLLGTFLLPICIIVLIDIFKKLFFNKNIQLRIRILTFVTLLCILGLTYILTKSIVITMTIVIWLYFLSHLLRRKAPQEYMIISSIAFLVFSLILTCEFIYVNDLFTDLYERQNTVAKSYIQILLLLPLVTTYIMYLLSKENYVKGAIRNIYIVTISILIILSSSFLVVGTYIKSHKFSYSYAEQNWHIPTLDGSIYIRTKYDGEYDGIMWLRKHANKDDVILETEGRAYSHFGRVASHTGIPSLINWAGSLSVLRGFYFYTIGNPRQEAINKIYRTIDKKEVIQLIKEYHITYIFIGPLERENYSKKELQGFKKEKALFKEVFSKGNTTIYKVKY